MIDKNDENVAPGIARVGNLLPTFYSHALQLYPDAFWEVSPSQIFPAKKLREENKGIIYYSLRTMQLARKLLVS